MRGRASGYSRATIREIARMANVTSASLYNYFPNKAGTDQGDDRGQGRHRDAPAAPAAEGPGDIVDRIEAVLDECGHLIREYPDLAAFEWVIRAENAPGTAPDAGRERRLCDVPQHHRGLVETRAGAVNSVRPGPRGAVEVIYAIIFGLTELAATLRRRISRPR